MRYTPTRPAVNTTNTASHATTRATGRPCRYRMKAEPTARKVLPAARAGIWRASRSILAANRRARVSLLAVDTAEFDTGVGLKSRGCCSSLARQRQFPRQRGYYD